MDTDPNDQQNLMLNLTHSILTEILDQVIGEFERAIGTEIGAVHVNPADSVTGKRTAQIEIRRTGGEKVHGLMRYKKILCDFEGLRNSDLCRMDEYQTRMNENQV